MAPPLKLGAVQESATWFWPAVPLTLVGDQGSPFPACQWFCTCVALSAVEYTAISSTLPLSTLVET